MQDVADFQVRCPSCKQGRLTLAPAGGSCRCSRCRERHPLDSGYLDLLPRSRERRTLAQVMMEWPPLIRIYESRLWRRSPAFALATRISFEREYSLIAGAGRLEPGQRLLDLACGPGIYVRRFAPAIAPGHAVGLDLSGPMLRYGAQLARSEGLENLLLVRGTAMDLPFEAMHFDLVNCCGALHLFPDVSAVLREVERVLAPGGRFTVAALRRGEAVPAEQVAKIGRCVLGIDAFTPDELSESLEGAGLTDVRCLHAAGRWLIMSAVKPGERRNGEAAVDSERRRRG